ncbi:MAG: tRNA pseudouridine(55) synthase TruB [Candidatus Omnitrophica bacterium]|nr:tRNA pseudouridine(55) synthase TruB [Candidatus Omnitrophota bacterium]
MTLLHSKKNLEVDGILIVDKPKGWTSHDVCAFVRRRFRIKKVGHAGTLDPLATGLLIVLLGKATKQSIPLTSCDKEYLGVMELGIETDTHDRHGKVTREASWENVTLENVRQKALDFTGEIIQVPPMVSALKHQGVRLYKLARKGQVVPREGRKVTVHNLKIEKKEGAFVHFFACVSKGTYLRTLVNDLGQSLGCLAALADLRRVRSGEFNLKDSVTIDQLKEFTIQDVANRMFPLQAFLKAR